MVRVFLDGTHAHTAKANTEIIEAATTREAAAKFQAGPNGGRKITSFDLIG